MIIISENHGILYRELISTKYCHATIERYAKSPLSILMPIARYPKSLSAKATAQKFNRPLLKLQKFKLVLQILPRIEKKRIISKIQMF